MSDLIKRLRNYPERLDHSAVDLCDEAADYIRVLEAQLERVRGLPMGQLIKALRVASDALEIAADWHVVDVQVWPPEAWNLPAYEEDAAEGWCSTQALSERLGKVADELEAALVSNDNREGE